MSTRPKPSDLRHIPVALRVTVDTRVWNEAPDQLGDAVRTYVVDLLNEDPSIVSARRDRT